MVWTLQLRPQRGDHCVRIGIIGLILVDLLLLMRDVYNDMSGWSPKQLRETFDRCANSILVEKVPFESDGPAFVAERCPNEFEAPPFNDSGPCWS